MSDKFNAQELLDKGCKAFDLEKFNEAYTLFLKGEALFPEETLFSQYKIFSLIRLDRDEEALALFETLLAAKGNSQKDANLQAPLEMAKAYLLLEMPQKALDELFTIESQDSEYFTILGQAYLDLNKNKEAIEAYKKSTEKVQLMTFSEEEPLYLVYKTMAKNLLTRGKVKRAEILLKEFYKENKALGYKILGDCYLELEKYKKAYESLEQSVELEAQDFQSHRLLGQTYFALNLPEKGEESYKEASQLNPKVYPEKAAHFEIAQHYFTEKKYEKALRVLNELGKDNLDQSLCRFKSILFCLLNRQEEAFNLLFDFFDGKEDCYSSLGFILEDLDQKEETKKIFEKWVEAYPESTEALSCLGYILAKLDQKEEAKKIIFKVEEMSKKKKEQ